MIFILLLLLLSGCSSQEKRETKDHLSLSFATEPTSLDVSKASFSSASNVFYFLYDGLMRVHPDGTVRPSLAKDVEVSPDYKRYLFHLRKAEWSSGALVEASDFERTWKGLLAPGSTSPAAQQLYCIKNGQAVHEGKRPISSLGVMATSSTTLLVELEYPCPYFLEMMAIYNFFPRAPEGEEGRSFNGPYVVEEWTKTRELKLKKNLSYWDRDVVSFEKVHIRFIPDPQTELKLFERGDIDWAGPPFSPTLPLDSIDALSKTFGVYSTPILSTYFFTFNTEKPPFDNRKVRLALSLSLPREEIVQHVTQGGEEPAYHFTPQLHLPAVALDDETLRRLFQEGAEGFKGPIEISYNISELHHNIALMIQQRWQELFGIDVILRGRDWRAHLSEIESGRFDVARMQWRGMSKDPIHFLELFEDPHYPMQRSGWKNQRFQELVALARLASEGKERLQFLLEAEEILTKEMPVAPLFFSTNLYVKQRDLEGFSFSDLGFIDFKWAHK